VAQCQRIRGENGGRRPWIALAGQDVEDDIGGMNALPHGLGAGRIDGWQPVGEHGRQDVDHLPIAVMGAGKLAPDPFHPRRQHPVLERRAVPERPRLPGQDRHVMPGIVNRLAAAEAAAMLRDLPSVLADDDALGIGMNFDGAADEYLLLSNRTRQVFDTEAGTAWKPSNRPA